MPGPAIKINKDAAGANFDQRVYDEGTGAGPFQPVAQAANSSGTRIDPATSTKQPALGTAGAASADVITVQGVASMTALKVDGSAVTHPISAVDLGVMAAAAATTDTGTFSAIAFMKRGLQNWTTFLARTPVLGTATMVNSSPVTLASDQPAVLVAGGRANSGADTASGRAHLTVGGSDGTNLRPAIVNSAGNFVVDSSGTAITGVTMPAGGVGFVGWLSAIMDAVRGSPNSFSDATRVPIDDRDGLTVTASVTSAATLFTQDLLGYQSISVHVTSAGTTCTITYEMSNDNTNWVSTAGLPSTALGNTLAQTTSTTAIHLVFNRTARYFRARVSTYGSGTVTVVAVASKVAVGNVAATSSSVTLVHGQAGHDGVVVGNPVRIAGRALTSDYVAVTPGDVADLKTTTVGALVVRPYAIPELEWNYAAAAGGILNTTTAVTVAAAAGAGLRNYITSFEISSEALGAATEFVIRDGAGGTVLWRDKISIGGRALTSVSFPSPLRSSAATLLEVATLTASMTGTVYINVQGYTAP